MVVAEHRVVQKWSGAEQVKLHWVPSQVAVPFAGATHAVHELPQLATEVFDTHCEPHLWKPATQVKSHVAPLQLGVAFAGAVHGVHDVPQLATSVFDEHCAPQR